MLSNANRWRMVAAVLAGLVAASCATTSSRPSPTPSNLGSTLSLCPGMRISNAPQTDAHGEVIGYSSLTAVHGVLLARAPVDACLSSGFGPRRGGASAFHYGVDLYTRTPAPVYAGGDGVIERIETRRGYGRTIVIRHRDGVETLYAHLSSYAQGLRRGARVRAGDIIGLTGDSGNASAIHLHYEIIVGGRQRNPLTIGG